MIDIVQAFWLALLQGITEFLPISSSGHLVLVPRILGWPQQTVAFDVAVHVGTLFAVVYYLRQDLRIIGRSIYHRLISGSRSSGYNLGGLIVLATLPAVLVGILIEPFSASLRQPVVIAATTAGFAVALFVADVYGSKRRTAVDLGWKDALIIGVAQALALIPGTSRAGITITAALALGVKSGTAARFSFLLSIPIISAAGVFKGLELGESTVAIPWSVFATGVIVSAVSSWLVIAMFLRWVERIGMLPFVFYRLILGALIFFWFR